MELPGLPEIILKVKMGTRLKVLRVFKQLHRTRMDVFKDDDIALKAARLKINDEFRKNRNETSEENINQMIKFGSDVETVLRESVVQMEHVGEDSASSQRKSSSRKCTLL